MSIILNKNINISCSLFYIINYKLYTWDRNDKQLKTYLNNFEEISDKVELRYPISNIFIEHDHFVVINNNGKILKANLSFSNFSKIQNNNYVYQSKWNYFNNNIITGSKDQNLDPPRLIHLYDIKDNINLWEQNINTRYVFLNQDLLLVDDSINGKWISLKRLSIDDGTTIWDKTLGSELVKFLGLHNNIAIINCNDSTIGIHVESGNVIWKHKFCHIYDQDSGKCFYLGGNKYISIDPETGDEIENVELDLDIFYPIRKTPVIFNDYIVSTNVKSNKIAFFNLKNKEYSSIHEIQDGFFLADEKFIQVSDDRLFALTSTNKLIIFEDNIMT